jgi:hypothetical protein
MVEKIKLDPNSELLRKVHDEYEEGLNYVESRRSVFRQRLKMYNNQKKNENLVGITTIYTLIRTLLAVYYSDEVTVAFRPRRLDSAEAMSNLDFLASFDHDEMQLHVKNYFNQWDRLFYGVGIRIFEDFDTQRMTPTVRTISPLSWHPDPFGDPESGFGYHGFEFVVKRDELTEAAGYDMQMVSKIEQVMPSDEVMQNMKAEKDAQGLSSGALDLARGNDNIAIYHHYTVSKGEKYLITTDGTQKALLRAVKLLPVGDEEKKNPSLVKFPVILNYYSPMRGAPFGVNVPDLSEDKQRMTSVLVNLMVSEAKSHLYPMGLYDARKIKNKRDLDFGFNKNIPVRLNAGESIDNVYRPLVRDTIDNTAFSVKELLEGEARTAVGADQLQSGMLGEKQRTLGEVQQVQSNANLGFLLQSRINAWGEKDFWKYWYREYKANFKKSQKKLIRVARPDGSAFMELAYKDFITVEDPDVDIVSKLEDAKQREKDSLEYLQSLPLILQDPTISQATRNQAKRLYFIKKGYSRHEIDMIVPPSPSELDALEENKVLSFGTPLPIKATDDHASHITVHRRIGNTTPEVLQHNQAHILAFMQSGEAMAMRQQEVSGENLSQKENLANMAQSQIGNRLTQMGKSNTNNLV